MAPLLRPLLLLLAAGCAAPEAERVAALQQAMTAGRTGLAAPSPLPVPPLPVASIAVPHLPAMGAARTTPEAAQQLLGLGPDGLRRQLGEPALRRREGPSEVWLYTAEGCALDLVLYSEGAGLRVAHAAARARGAESRTEAACLREIAAGGVGGGGPARAGRI